MKLQVPIASVEAAEGLGHAPLAPQPSSIGIATTTAAGEIVGVDDAFAAMLRTRPQDLVGKHLSEPPQQRSQRRYIAANGEEIWLDVSATRIHGRDGRVEQIAWMFEDSSAERAGRMASITHEFNNVLMGIAPFVELIRRGKNVDASLDHITRALERGKRVTAKISGARSR
jgi:PAS domain-containing protein